MKLRTLAYAIAFGSLWSFAAAAQEIPRFDVAASCKTAQALTKEDHDPIQACIQNEQEAERQLRPVWSKASAAQRQDCAEKALEGGPPSYVDVLVCLQMYQGSNFTIPPRHRRKS